MIEGLVALHEQKIVHRDIKCANVFLSKDGGVKLGDMNVSKRLQRGQLKTQIGTPYYMSPEVCQSKPYNYTSDVWALGCILYELCTLKHAFSGENLLGLVFKIVQEKHEPIPTHYSKEMQSLITQMLNKDEKKRP
mgnify:CR=1 FL=1